MKLLRLLAMAWVALLLALAAPAQAQLREQDRAEYQAWIKTADRAEEVVDAGRASSAALEKLRSDLARFREEFSSVRSENGARISTLEGQLAALPPKPEGDATEPADIADLRAHLQSRLDKLLVPRIVAEEAFFRANGLIAEIDRMIRERETRKLLTRGASPLAPSSWAQTYHDGSRAVRGLINETRTNLAGDVPRENLRDNAVLIAILTFLGGILICSGGALTRRAMPFLTQMGGHGARVIRFMLSLEQIVIPLIGVVLLTQAVSIIGVLGFRGQLILAAVPGWATIFLIFHWIGNRMLVRGQEAGLADLSPMRLRELHFQIDFLAIMIVLWNVVGLFERIEDMSATTHSTAVFPIILMAALILWRIQRVRPTLFSGVDEAKARKVGFSGLVEAIRKGLLLLCALSPVLAAIGYTTAAEALIFPSVNTLALISIIVLLQRFLGDLVAWLTGKPDLARDSLFTVLAGFALSILAIPPLILIWGGRVANLTELWTRFLEGVRVGDTTVSPTTFVTFAAIFGIGYMLTKLMQGGLRNSLLPKTKIDPGGQNAIVSGTGYVGIVLAAILAITGAGMDLSSLAIVAGALSVGIGFGLQTIVSNFVSGIILLIERPISKGDWIEVNGMMGYVRDISVRSTRVETFDRTDVIVPNSDLISGTVTNFTRGNTIGRVIVPVGVAYGTDTRKIETILGEIANAHPMVLANPAPSVVFQGFGADSLDFEIRAILRDVNWVLSVKSDMNHEINRRFVEEGIEIPFAQRDVWLRNPETLSGNAPKPVVPSPAQPASDRPVALEEGDMDGEADADR